MARSDVCGSFSPSRRTPGRHEGVARLAATEGGKHAQLRAHGVASRGSGDADRRDTDLDRAGGRHRPSCGAPGVGQRVAYERDEPSQLRPGRAELRRQRAPGEDSRKRQQRRDGAGASVDVGGHARARRTVGEVRSRPRERLIVGDAGIQREDVGLKSQAALAALVLLDEHAELPACPLRNLAVLLTGPAVASAELACAHVDADLACEDELLISAEVADHLAQLPQLGHGDHPLLDGGGSILEVGDAVLG